MRITGLAEPGVAITDFILALETFTLVTLLASKGGLRTSATGLWFISMFGCLASASLTGGILHGFFNTPSQQYHMLFWDAALISIGGVAFSCCNLAATLLPPLRNRSSLVGGISVAALLLYIWYVVTGYRTFLTAIIFYLPATILLLAAIIDQHRKKESTGTLCGVLGIVLTFVAAGIQQLQFYIEPYVLNHNTLYHIVQGIALWLIYRYAASVKAQSQ